MADLRTGTVKKYPDGTISYDLETAPNSGVFQTWNPPAGFVPTPAKVAIPKPVDKTWPTTPGQLDLDKYGDIAPLLNGFRYTDFFRLANEPVSRQLKQQDLVAFLSLTESERSDMSIRSKVYAEIGGSQLNHPQLGDLQHHAQFVTASTQNLVEALHANFDGRYAGVNRVGFNFESTYMPAYDKWSVVLEKFGPNAANISWLCEWGPVKGQTRTLLQLWNGNLFQGEIAQRMVNRHVALVMYTKARCGNTTKVANSDGSVVYYVGLSQNDDSFNERDNLTAGASFYNYFWDTSANFDPFTLEPNGVNLSFSHQNKKLWDVQDWMNIYKYTNTGVLDPADFDALNGAAQNYPLLWSKVKPSQEWVDLNIPVWFDINQRKLAQVGRGGIPVSYQFHYRYEEGIQRGDDYDTKSKAFGLDEAVCPPWFNFQIAVLGIMSAKNPESGITNWSTVKRYPDSIWDNNINATRPQGDRISVRAAKLQMAKFREYFNPANNPVILYRNFLRYPVSGGAYGASAVDGGNGFYRRTPKDIGSAGNPSDRRTKANVIVRVIEKNGAKWALIAATNQRLNRADPMTLDLRLRPAEVPGLSGIVDVTGISLAGFEDTFVREVCLEPEKLGTVAAGTGTTTTPVTTPVAASEIPFEPVAANMDAWGTADMFYLENAQIKVGLRKSVGGCVCHMSSKTDNIGLINDLQITHNGVLESDKGRQLQFVSNYGTPVFSFFQNVGDTNDFTTNDTGNNPVQGGNRATTPDPQGIWNKSSPMLACEVRDNVAGRGRVLYYKVNPYHWSLPSTAGPSQLIGEVWVWLDGPALRFVVRVTNNRTDTQRIYEGREQEMPCLYATAGYYRHFVYQGNAPFTGGALTEVTLPNPALITEGNKEEHGQPRYASENFMMALESTGTKGITLWLPKNSRFMNKQFGSRVGGETDNGSSYIAGGPVMDFDNNCVYVYSGAAVVGEKDFMRNWVTSQTRIAAGFEFNFGYTNDFWASVNGDMRLSNGVLTMNFGKANNDGARREGVFFSPQRVWSAADLRTIYITGAFKGVSRMAFCVTGSKVDDGNVDGKYGFNVIGDGVERTYIVDLSAVTMPATVCRVGICHHPDTVNSDIGAEAWLKPKRIANTAPDTTAPAGTTTPVSTITRVGHHYDSNTDAAEIAIQRTDSREYKAAIYPVGTAETAIVWRSMTAGSWTYSGVSFNLQTATILNIPAGTYQLSVQPDGVPSERVTRTVTYGNTNVDGQLN